MVKNQTGKLFRDYSLETFKVFKTLKVLHQRAKVALKEGEPKKAFETARKMLAKGFNLAEIAELTDLSIDELSSLK